MLVTNRPHSESLATEDSRNISRRTLTRGAAWTAPLVIVSVPAPTYAASQCLEGMASLVVPTRPTQLTFPPSAVTATVSFSSTGVAGNDQTPGDTGLVQATAFSPSWNYIKLHHPNGMTTGDTVTMTLVFSQPLQGVSLRITDIDRDTGEWIDQLIVDTLGFTAAPGPNVIGAGTSASPFRSSVNGGISSDAGDLGLTWPGTLSQVQLTYRVGDNQNGSNIGQHIGVGQIGFDNC